LREKGNAALTTLPAFLAEYLGSVRAMSGAEVLDVGRDALWLTIQLCAPVLIVGLIVGVGIGLFQALTQIQEQSLVYAPKIIAIFVSLLLFLPLMGGLLGAFMREIAARISGM
jgi:flagellar biosynthetic protein FliQ